MAEWKYLYSEPFHVRGVIAAHYLQDCPNIIEIGSYKVPITDFLTHRFEQAVCVDPLTQPRNKGRVLHAREDYRFFDFKPFLQRPFGLVLLGMDLPFDFKLFHLAASARRVIVEFPPKHGPSRVQFEILRKAANLQIDLNVGIDLTENDFGDLSDSSPVFSERRLYVLSPFNL